MSTLAPAELVERIWQRDPSVWTGRDEAHWLGWLDEPPRMRERVNELGIEHRSVEFRDVELDGYNFRGYAAVFDTPWKPELTQELGYQETVARGAFRKALKDGGNIPLLWDHDRRSMLATTFRRPPAAAPRSARG